MEKGLFAILRKIASFFWPAEPIMLQAVWHGLEQGGQLATIGTVKYLLPEHTNKLYGNNRLTIEVIYGLEWSFKMRCPVENAETYKITLVETQELFRIVFVGQELDLVEAGELGAPPKARQKFYGKFGHFASLDMYYAEKIRMAVKGAVADDKSAPEAR